MTQDQFDRVRAAHEGLVLVIGRELGESIDLYLPGHAEPVQVLIFDERYPGGVLVVLKGLPGDVRVLRHELGPWDARRGRDGRRDAIDGDGA